MLNPHARFIVGFPGRSICAELKSFFDRGLPAGVILFSHNIESTGQLAELMVDLRALWPDDHPTPLFCVDQEGGIVRRLRPPHCPEFLDVAEMGLLAERLSTDEMTTLGRLMGQQMAAIGFNLDFAPVVDVDTNPANPIIGIRAFGKTPEVVIDKALAWARGCHEGGVLTCAKHFPGHGDTDLDSHKELPTLSHSMKRLREVELVPFVAAADADIPTMMTAHIIFEALDAELPATLSPTVIPKLLREEMGYQGVVISDDLEMRAIYDRYTPEQVVQGMLDATVDIFLNCPRLSHTAALADAVGRLETPEQHAEAMARIRALQRRASDNAKAATATIPGQQELQALLDKAGVRTKGWLADGAMMP